MCQIIMYSIIHSYTLNTFTDIDTHDQEPTEELVDLYYYKAGQLWEIISKVYNSDDIKQLSSKMAQEQCGPVNVRDICIYCMYV